MRYPKQRCLCVIELHMGVNILLLAVLVNGSVTIPPIYTPVFTFTQNPVTIVSLFRSWDLPFQERRARPARTSYHKFGA